MIAASIGPRPFCGALSASEGVGKGELYVDVPVKVMRLDVELSVSVAIALLLLEFAVDNEVEVVLWVVAAVAILRSIVTVAELPAVS